MSSFGRLRDKVAIVTASTAGIGLGIATRLASEGAKVVISSRKQESVDQIVRDLKSKNFECAGLACHVGANLKSADCEISHPFGPDGGAPYEYKWSIIFITSYTAFNPAPPIGMYAVSKTALLGLTKALAEELGPERHIRVNAVAPGVVPTKFAAALVATESMRQHTVDKTLLRKLGTPENIAAVVAMLASDDGSYITGETIVVAGGMQREHRPNTTLLVWLYHDEGLVNVSFDADIASDWSHALNSEHVAVIEITDTTGERVISLYKSEVCRLHELQHKVTEQVKIEEQHVPCAAASSTVVIRAKICPVSDFTSPVSEVTFPLSSLFDDGKASKSSDITLSSPGGVALQESSHAGTCQVTMRYFPARSKGKVRDTLGIEQIDDSCYPDRSGARSPKFYENKHQPAVFHRRGHGPRKVNALY
eukprot:jgi/Picre1/35379/NNA_002841.t1